MLFRKTIANAAALVLLVGPAFAQQNTYTGPDLNVNILGKAGNAPVVVAVTVARCGAGANIGGNLCRGYITAGTTSVTVPLDWNNSNNSVEVLGPGGTAAAGGATTGGGGGAGGSYGLGTNVQLTPGASIVTAVGAGGSGTSTLFNNGAITCPAGGNASTGTGGSAGGSCTGASLSSTVVGGAGGNGRSGFGAGGGGGAGGANGAGGAGGSPIALSVPGGGGGGSDGASAGANSGNGGGAGGAGGPGSGLVAMVGQSGNPGTWAPDTQGGLPNAGGGAGAQRNTTTTTTTGGAGGAGQDWDATHGAGGGGGGGGGAGAGPTNLGASNGGNGGQYGGGAGGGGNGAHPGAAGTSGAGLIVFTYSPVQNTSVAGFASNGTFATATATGSSSAATFLPSGTTVKFTNTGTTGVSCVLGDGTAVAVANELQIFATGSIFQVVGSNTRFACIDQSGSVSNLVIAQGGSGLGMDSGGSGLIQADTSTPIAITTATTTELVALTSAKVIYVTAFDVIAAGTGNFKLVYGTGTACATGQGNISGDYNLAAQVGLTKGGGGPVFIVPIGNALCAITSAAVTISGSLAYVKR